MSSSDRRAFLSLSVLALAGCGFTPALGPGGSATALRGRVEIDEPSDIDGFELVRALEVRLGAPEAPLYRLGADILIADEGVGILPDQTITRFNILGRVDYRLTEIATGEMVASGQVKNFTSYAATSTTVATTSAQRDARDRLMVILADQIAAELVLAAQDLQA
jgi:LPS-assembly lipoprotein